MKNANLSLLFLLGCFASFAQQSASRKPNIIYIYADDLGYGAACELTEEQSV